MLILTRQVGEALKIGDSTEVRVLSINENQVRIGVDAPRDIEVHREEIYKRIKQGLKKNDKPEESAARDDPPHKGPSVAYRRRRRPSLS